MTPAVQKPPTLQGSLPPCQGYASEKTRAQLEARLKIAGRPGQAGVRLIEVGFESESVLWFVFQDASGEKACLAVSPAGGKPWAFSGRTLKIAPRQQAPGCTELQRRATECLGSRLDGRSFRSLLDLVRKGAAPPPSAPDAAPGSAPASAPMREGRPASGLHCEDWAHPSHWREFCCFPTIEWCPGETLLGSIMLAGSACSIRYGDFECHRGHLYINQVAQTPWAFTKDGGGARCGSLEYITVINDQDVIHGTGVGKVEDLLNRLADEPSQRSLQFINCCIPMMTGDNVRGLLARFQEKTRRKVVYTDMSAANCHQESLSQYIRRELAATRPSGPRPPSGRFNLVGFRGTRGRDELVELLSGVDAELNVAILPEVDPKILAGCRNAAVQVFMPNTYYREIYEAVEAQGLRALRGISPYGWTGSMRWLRALGQALGGTVPARMKAALARLDRERLPEWGRLSRRAAAHRAGFVVGPGDAARLADPACSGGVQVPKLLAEMGFGLDFLVFRERGRADDPELSALTAGLPGPGRHRVAPFSDRDGLCRRLRTSGLSIVYSNIRNDRRLTRNGLVGFSLRDLEMGPAGALRTLQRLVERCELPFFRKNVRLLRGAR